MMTVPNTLFKFRNWGEPGEDRILTHREIRLTKPSDLDADYTEGRLPDDFDSVSEEDLDRLALHHAKGQLPNGSPKAIESLAKKLRSQMVFHDLENRLRAELLHKQSLDKYLGIFCTSYEWHHIEMWEKMANLGQGYCVELATQALIDVIPGFGYVSYYPSGKTPKQSPISFSSEKRVAKMEKAIYSIPDTYQYERELRFKKVNHDNKGNLKAFSTKDRLLILPPEAYHRIILGYDISDEDKEAIIGTRNQKLPGLEIKTTRIKNQKVILDKTI